MARKPPRGRQNRGAPGSSSMIGGLFAPLGLSSTTKVLAKRPRSRKRGGAKAGDEAVILDYNRTPLRRSKGTVRVEPIDD